MNDDSIKFENSGVIALYVHIPFCRKKCSYCDFCSFVPSSEEEMDDYVEILLREFLLWKERIEKEDIKTIYIGGGTPSVLKPYQLEKILKEWISTDTKEISVEANPESLNEDFLKCLHDSGVRRISIGVQTFKDELLGLLGRVHSSKDARRAIEMARKYSFSLSVDLIFGIPGQSFQDFVYDVESVMNFSPEHISCYILQPFEKTEMSKLMKKVDEEIVREMFLFLCNFAKENGYYHYEISNFAKPGYECLHNLNYWRMGFYAGCGLSSSSHLPSGFLSKHPVRTSNFSSMEAYINSIKKGLFPFEEIEEITPDKWIKETIMLGLRTFQGVSISFIEKFLGKEKASGFLNEALSLGLKIDGSFLKFEEKDWLLFNYIVSRLFYLIDILKGQT